MRKIVINDDWGGFGISFEAMQLYAKLSGFTLATDDYDNEYLIPSSGTQIYDSDLQRDDPILIQVIEQLGNKANGIHASLKIVEIPDDVEWVIQEYDGIEHVAEKHRTWC